MNTFFDVPFSNNRLDELKEKNIRYLTISRQGVIEGWIQKPYTEENVWLGNKGQGAADWSYPNIVYLTIEWEQKWDKGYYVRKGNVWNYEELGVKWDENKARWDLLPLHQVEGVVWVLTYGAQKYGPDNWRKVPDAKNRYFAAMMRHINEYRRGVIYDEESGSTHLSHAMCCMLFLMELEGERDED